MAGKRRTVFFVSDQTGVTAETLGRSLLVQFEDHDFDQVTLPFIDSTDKADELILRINAVAAEEGVRPIIFSTLVHEPLRRRFARASALFLDFFDVFLDPLEEELQVRSSHMLGRSPSIRDSTAYERRIDATDFALRNDDGTRVDEYGDADVILVGVSRTGKTPTCLYLALTYGVFAANYPLSEEELEAGRLPAALEPHRRRLHGLTISPERLRQIRHERRPVGRYASARQVGFELRAAESLFSRCQIPCIDTTALSIEEIASTILSGAGIERRTRR